MSDFLHFKAAELERPIYRFVTFSRLLQYLKTGEYPLLSPSKWDDPFENYIIGAEFRSGAGIRDLGVRHKFYGSCWTRKSVSDALWRIYSPDKMSVRIRSTPQLLGTRFESALAKYRESKLFIGRVQYLAQSQIEKRAPELAKKILNDRSELAAANSLLFKRKSFAHEDEVRVLVVDHHRRGVNGILNIKVDPHAVIEGVLIDSRAPKEVVEMYTRFLKRDLNFKGRVSQSTLYNRPAGLTVQVE